MAKEIVKPEDAIKFVTEKFGIGLTDLVGSRRLRSVSRARQFLMFILRKSTSMSLSEIGTLIGGRDHTTALHSIRRVQYLIEEENDREFVIALADWVRRNR